MDIKRAHEIIDSPSNIEVLYKDDAVWMENVCDKSGKASIVNLNSNEHMDISLAELRETGRIEPYSTT